MGRSSQAAGSCLLLALCTSLLLSSTAHGAATSRKTLTLRLRRRDGVARTRGLLRNATLPLHGAVRDYGYFYASLALGTPAKNFAVIVDTGSTITYVPCTTCGSSCGTHHKGVAFDPALSTTFVAIGCNTDKCTCGRPACGCSGDQQCTYSRTYAEQSSSSGLLLQDTLHLRGDALAVPVIFGCETRETGEIFNQEADGILGLGNSPISLINQLAAEGVVDDVFSLCFGSVEGDGALMLGDVPLPPGLVLQHTPLLHSPAHPHYYIVNLLRLTVGGADLNVSRGLYEEGYGTVLDSGTTFTYLPTEAFTAFVNVVTDHAIAAGLHMTDGPDKNFHDICYGGAPPLSDLAALERVFPAMELHFPGPSVLRAGPLNYLFVHSLERGAYCLGVFDNQHQGTLLGGITFRNIFIQYDRRNHRVGFGAAACQQLGMGGLPDCPANATSGSRKRPDGSREDLDCNPVQSAPAAVAAAPQAGAGSSAASIETWRSYLRRFSRPAEFAGAIIGVTVAVGVLMAAVAVALARRRQHGGVRDWFRMKLRGTYVTLGGLDNSDKVSEDGTLEQGTLPLSPERVRALQLASVSAASLASSSGASSAGSAGLVGRSPGRDSDGGRSSPGGSSRGSA